MSRVLHLREWLDGEVSPMPSFDPPLRELSADTRELGEGDVFVALAGATTHGLRHADQAQAAKVAAIVYEAPAPEGVSPPANAVPVAGLRAKLGRLADKFYASPSKTLAMTGVTGTNGKTSTVQLIAQALDADGVVVGSIGTLGAGLHGRLVSGERTTPDVVSVHRLLAKMRDQGASQVAMEVSSHALEQGRVDGVAFKVAVFTNLTRDHLDFHGTMQAYGAAKAKLFAWPSLQAAVVNLDDAFGTELLAKVDAGVRRIGLSSRGHEQATLRADEPQLSPEGIRFVLREDAAGHPVRSPLLGRFNIDNLLAVAGALRALGWSLEKVAAALPRLSPVGGRMSRVGGERGLPLVVVDYAHTPDALEQALSSLREHRPRRLICVFGCGGDRDRGKRPEMAAIAERSADRVIVTDDNPRSEDGDAIVADILAGFVDAAGIEVQRDRARAIALALQGSSADDIVLVAGKGHETYQEVAGVKYEFDDLAVARQLLGERE